MNMYEMFLLAVSAKEIPRQDSNPNTLRPIPENGTMDSMILILE